MILMLLLIDSKFLILLMQERVSKKSPYLSAPKTKHGSFFPKIHQNDYRGINREIIKSIGKQVYNKN